MHNIYPWKIRIRLYPNMKSSCYYLIHDSWGLQPVGEDDIRVHGPDVEMVDDRVLQPGRRIPQVTQLLLTKKTGSNPDKTQDINQTKKYSFWQKKSG